MHESLVKSAKGATQLHAMKASDLSRWLAKRASRETAWLKSTGFAAKDHELVLVPDSKGGLACAVLGLGKGTDKLALAQFSESLPPGSYAFGDVAEGFGGANGALAWILGTYQFTSYRKGNRKFPKLVVPQNVNAADVSRIAEGVFLARDLINTPSNDMGPEELAAAARDLAKKHGAKFSVILGDELLKKNFPLIHAVGRARRAEADTGGQGRMLRQRRARPEKFRRHAHHEERYGWFRDGARPRTYDHGRETECAAARADSGRGKFRFRQCLSSGRCFSKPQGPCSRNRQHRRGRPSCSGGCTDGSRFRKARTADRSGDADRRCARRDRHGAAAILHRLSLI